MGARKGLAVIWKERHNAQNSRLSLIREVEAYARFCLYPSSQREK
jgi:hypothetical protein